MKRTDLKPGHDYLATRSNDWQTRDWGRQRVRVLNTAIKIQPIGWRTLSVEVLATVAPAAPQTKVSVAGVPGGKYAKHTHVVVQNVNEDGELVGHAYICLTSRIKATWAEAERILAEHTEAVAKARAIKVDRQAARKAQFDAMLPELEAIWTAADAKCVWVDESKVVRTGTITMSLSQVQALLDAR